MPIEYEAKVLDIDPVAIADHIVAAGGERRGEVLMRRYVYDIVPGDQSKWIRLRDDGTQTTLTIKEIAHDGIDGTSETEVSVSEFETTNELLGKLGYQPKSYQENRRISFLLGDARLEIDSWPLIPPYLEVEADSHEEVLAAAARLGFDESRLTGENTLKIYTRYGFDLPSMPDLRFPDTA